MRTLTHRTVFGELLEPLHHALDYVRYSPSKFPTLSMTDFIGLGVLRHLQGIGTLREQVQSLQYQMSESTSSPPLARSTWADAMSSKLRLKVMEGLTGPLLRQARKILPNRLQKIPDLGDRPVYAMDGTYQKERAHFRRKTPKQGGNDNPKGHALLSFYDVRLGCPADVYVDTRSRHETAMLRDYDAHPDALTHDRGALWVVDRAFIDASYWDSKKQSRQITMITRMKSGLVIESQREREVEDIAINTDIVSDEIITLRSSDKLPPVSG
jgi:hypothetical protein